MSARLTVSEVDTRAETIILTGTRDNLRRVEAWLHGDVDVVPAGTLELLRAEIAALRRERDGLLAWLKQAPAIHRQLALSAYRQGHHDGQHYEQTAHYESEGWDAEEGSQP